MRQPVGEKSALDMMAPQVYHELRRLARYYLSDHRPNHTLQPTALVHEAYLRLIDQRSVDFGNRAQFIGIAAGIMRRVLLNYARARHAAKRGPGFQVESTVSVTDVSSVDLLDLNRALLELGQLDPQQERIVELRFFGGLSVEETAEVLQIGTATVKRHWASARLFLFKQMKGA